MSKKKMHMDVVHSPFSLINICPTYLWKFKTILLNIICSISFLGLLFHWHKPMTCKKSIGCYTVLCYWWRGSIGHLMLLWRYVICGQRFVRCHPTGLWSCCSIRCHPHRAIATWAMLWFCHHSVTLSRVTLNVTST